jgi:hypothetical protein
MSDLLNVFSTAGLWIETAIEPQLTEEAARRYPRKRAWMNKYLGILIPTMLFKHVREPTVATCRDVA